MSLYNCNDSQTILRRILALCPHFLNSALYRNSSALILTFVCCVCADVHICVCSIAGHIVSLSGEDLFHFLSVVVCWRCAWILFCSSYSARACAFKCASEGSLFAFIVMGQNGLFYFWPSSGLVVLKIAEEVRGIPAVAPASPQQSPSSSTSHPSTAGPLQAMTEQPLWGPCKQDWTQNEGVRKSASGVKRRKGSQFSARSLSRHCQIL